MARYADPMLPHASNFCLCRSCGCYFMNPAAFDAHRVGEYGPAGDRRCMTTPQMQNAGLEIDSRGYWRWPKREAPSLKSETPEGATPALQYEDNERTFDDAHCTAAGALAPSV